MHLLAILGQEKTTSDIDSLLGAVGFVGTKGSNDMVTTESFEKVVDAISRVGGIAIPAHVDGPHGLFSISGASLNQNLDCQPIIAMELIDLAFKNLSFITIKT